MEPEEGSTTSIPNGYAQQHITTTTSSSSPTQPIRILTLNVWGIKYISKLRHQRITYIGHLLATSPHPPHIVALQEIFTYADYLTLRHVTRSILPYGRFYHSGAFGAGLAILSAWPLVEGRMQAYTLCGRPSAFWRGDWYVGKGVAWARIRIPEAFSGGGERRELEVFNTHLHAPYNEGTPGKDTYACHRAAEAWQIGGMMRRAVERGSLVLGCGDFNMVPGGLEYAVMKERTGEMMRDTWREVHPESSIGAWIDDVEQTRLKTTGGRQDPPSVNDSLTLHGHTCDSIRNTWRWSKAHQKDLLRHGTEQVVDPGDPDPKAKRLDYIFLGDRSQGSTVTNVEVCMTERHPDLKCSLTDHFGVLAEITLHPGPSGGPNLASSPYTHDPTLPSRLLALLKLYTSRSRLHRRRRMTHFLISVPVTLGCYVAIWFAPTGYAALLLCVLASLGLFGGVVDGLLGGLFGGVELRKLMEWEGEIRGWAREHGGGVIGAGGGEKKKDGEGGGVEEWEKVRDWFD